MNEKVYFLLLAMNELNKQFKNEEKITVEKIEFFSEKLPNFSKEKHNSFHFFDVVIVAKIILLNLNII